ncbi:MAG TPA: MFS transporter [Nitrososphaerales archaeon]|nr:MFS transporter [Nitrososphaerales archaeon]
MSAAVQTQTVAVTAKTTSHQARALLSMVGVALLLNYVETMVIPGVPTIQKDFGATASTVSWITSAFLIVGSAVSPLLGKLGDSYGKKRMFLVALAFYTAGVAMAGFSPSIYWLIGARAIQGIGFAIVPLALAIIAETFPRERIAAAQGIISATFAVGAAIGLVLGAYIVEDWGWQWAFHTALIASVALFLVVAKALPTGRPGTGAKVNYVTIGLLMVGISLVLLYLTEGPFEGWYSAYDLAALGAGAALTVGFFVAESKISNPLIQLRLLKITNVQVANAVGIISGIAMFGLFFALTYYTQLPVAFGGLGLSVINSGLAIAPATVMMLIGGPVLGRMVQKTGPKPTVILGSLIAIAGMVLFLTNRATTLDVTVDTAVSMVGIVGIIIPIVNMITISLPVEAIGAGLGLNTMLRNIGGAVGPVLATTLMSTYTLQVPPHTLPPGVTVPSGTAFDYIFYLGIAALAVGVVFALFSKNYVLKQGAGSAAPVAH